MRIDEMITAVRLDGKINSASVDYTAARIRQELTDCLRSVFGSLIVAARAGTWLKQEDVAVTTGKSRYRIPHRAFSIESVEIVGGSGMYELIGDQVVFTSAPPVGAYVRFTYYLSPSLLCEEQTVGLVTAHSDTLGTVTIGSLPLDKLTGLALASQARVDIVHPNGWNELALVGKVQALSGAGPYTLTFAQDVSLADVEDGDYVRVAQQTDWPCLQSDFHRTLCTLTAARLYRVRGDEQKAAALEVQCGIVPGEDRYVGDLGRFVDSLEPRVKDAPRGAVPRGNLLRRGGRGRGSATTFEP